VAHGAAAGAVGTVSAGPIWGSSWFVLAEPMQVAMNNGARRTLVPLENKRNFLEVPGDIVERVDPIFFSDPMTAAMKALGMT
jgi:predicted ATP-dependent Lon-type protease